MKNLLKKIGPILRFIKKHIWISSAALVVIIAALILVFLLSGKDNSAEFATAKLEQGNLRQIVTATGEIRPVNTINVGSQVSGNIENIFVDYNSKVKKGEVLLKIDTQVLQASVDEAKASLLSAKSQQSFAKSEYERSKSLYNDGFIARAEMEQAKTNYETGEQSVKRADSQYQRAMTNFGYATITSPVDGTVIARKVDMGQTVAASFQTPDLFEIAEDLTSMQIETSVSEADIGMIKEEQKVSFTVDAYPTESFEGNVKQIRLSPTTTSNVVVYTVVIDVNNLDLKLMPGMTAFVTIIIAEKTNVWKAANSSLLLRSFEGIVEKPGDSTTKSHLAIQRGKEIKLIPFKKGLITPTETEIIADDLEKDDKIITGKRGQQGTSAVQIRMGGGPR